MSIFESKEYSSISVSKSSNEEFDSNYIMIRNVDNEPNIQNKNMCIINERIFKHI